MASSLGISKVLAIAGTVWPRDVTPELVGIYAGALGDLDDDQLMTAIRGAVKACKFFPTPAELREFAGVTEEPINVDWLLDQIDRLSSYDPVNGTKLPCVALVRERLGEDVAAGYALAGGAQLFSRNEFGRIDAVRIFRREIQLARLVAAGRATLPALPGADENRPALEPGDRLAAS